jgi:hypothetical protein
MRCSIVALLAVVLAGAGCRSAAQIEELPAGRWMVLGPGGGGAQMNVAVSPHDPSLVFNSTDMSSCFVSADGGAHWRSFLLGATCQFAFDARRAELIYAAVGFSGLYRSVDRGRSWSLVLPEPSQFAGRQKGDDEGTIYLADKDGALAPAVRAVAADPVQSGRVAANIGRELWLSLDAGQHWTHSATLPGEARQVWIAPRQPLQIFAAGSNFFGSMQD